jgi:hypothetical protein
MVSRVPLSKPGMISPFQVKNRSLELKRKLPRGITRAGGSWVDNEVLKSCSNPCSTSQADCFYIALLPCFSLAGQTVEVIPRYSHL